MFNPISGGRRSSPGDDVPGCVATFLTLLFAVGVLVAFGIGYAFGAAFPH